MDSEPAPFSFWCRVLLWIGCPRCRAQEPAAPEEQPEGKPVGEGAFVPPCFLL